jgi:hypothetical protein
MSSNYLSDNITKDEPTILNILTDIIEITIKYVYVHPVSLQLIFDPLDNETFDYDKYPEIKRKIINSITWNTLIVDQELKIAVGKSKRNGNTDNRGGGCGNLKIPIEDFEYTVKNKNGITIKDITEIVYRLKGSKYDWWYELFCCVENIKLDDHSIEFTTDFDYGF